MRLYIIGNGFDLNHGLKSSYSNYRDFLFRNHYNILRSFEDLQFLENCHSDSLWTDLEFSLSLNYEEMAQSVIEDGYPDLMSDSDSRWNNIQCQTEDDLKFIHDFTGDCLISWLSSISTVGISKKFILGEGAYVTFNYTNTLEYVYKIPPNNILHIHGVLGGIGENKIQFGSINNDWNIVQRNLEQTYGADEFYGASIEFGVRNIVDYCKNSYKCLFGNYDRLKKFLFQFSEINEIVIMGHSFEGIDEEYYRDIFVPLFKNKKWIFYTYTLDDNYKYQNFVKKYGIDNSIQCRW